MKVWVARDRKTLDDGIVRVFEKKPDKEVFPDSEGKDIIEFDIHQIDMFSTDYRSFKKYFGYIPKKGSCEKINLRLEK